MNLEKLLDAWRRLQALKPESGRDKALVAFASGLSFLVAALISWCTGSGGTVSW